MSEHTPKAPHEKFESSHHEQIADRLKELEKQHHEKLNEKPEKSQEKIEQATIIAHEEAKTSEQMLQEVNKDSEVPENEPRFINYELKEIAYQRLLKHTRKHLSPFGRTMSKVMHQPVVDTASEVVAKTVGRPSGIIGGGLVALVGTSIYYYLTKHYGYSYNAFVFLMLMCVGFVMGWLVEIIYKSVASNSKK